MNFSLIICTYKRPQVITKLLESVFLQNLVPNEIIVVDSSPDVHTKDLLKGDKYRGLKYYKVGKEDQGLTRQRNFGIRETNEDIEVITFLDDDIILEPDYFENLIATYSEKPDAIGVGGYIINEVDWRKAVKLSTFNEFTKDGYTRNLGSRNLLRKKLGLLSDKPPGFMPEYSNGLSIGFLPPSGKTYPVEFFMGGVASYRKKLFKSLSFSNYFEGYGLYEDMDFCIRASRLGQLYVNTSARVIHNHAESGRPDHLKYGKMVIRNGWYVWRLKHPQPCLTNKLKWYATAILLGGIRFGNVLTTKNRSAALFESLGRLSGLVDLLFHKPKINQ
ncbi:glycosyltransferase family 2 protein [Antarcticibacterium flavum]|uniref:Glycosyltransferase family 2 protein n=1 Tax=Antarcticibacterium flavum TaxID=2058175 RepID=A0A5B7X5D1_9FLAO|nr:MULTISPECIES: glycosyltransferase [Antarcticibacterium]MCM4161388.1 glycosyl transferase family 2 [Antarcticibacterium sp. W02-3]QCY70587.1 glycosyltransferase family 2 protein [Antarcticibacterium flavum]